MKKAIMKNKPLVLLGMLAVALGCNVYSADEDSLTEKQKRRNSNVNLYKRMGCSDSEARSYAIEDYREKEKSDKWKKKLIKDGLKQHDVDNITNATSGFTPDKRAQYIAEYVSKLNLVNALETLGVPKYPYELLQFVSLC